MGECFEIYLVKATINTHGKGNKNKTWSEFSLEALPDALEALDAKIFNKTFYKSRGFLNTLSKNFNEINFWPWAIIFFQDEYRLSGHIKSISTGEGDIYFTALSRMNETTPPKVPAVSIIMPRQKQTLKDAAAESPLFEAPWKDLVDKDINRRWICLSDPPPKKWVKTTSKGDDELFLKLTNQK